MAETSQDNHRISEIDRDDDWISEINQDDARLSDTNRDDAWKKLAHSFPALYSAIEIMVPLLLVSFFRLSPVPKQTTLSCHFQYEHSIALTWSYLNTNPFRIY